VKRLVRGMLVRERPVLRPGTPGQHRPNVRRMPSQAPRRLQICRAHGMVTDECNIVQTVEWSSLMNQLDRATYVR
jgi:hypothetical protein